MRKKIIFRKKNYSSQAALANSFGISPQLLFNRLRIGWSMEESLGLVQRQKPPAEGKPVFYRGKRYPSISALALSFDLKPSTFCARLKRKWTFEQALGIEEAPDNSKTKGRRVRTTLLTKKGKMVFGTFKEAAEWCGVDRRVAVARKLIGWTLEQAMEQEDPPEQAYAGYGAIYLVRNLVDGRCYVGQTMQRIQRRWKGHLRSVVDGAKTRLAEAMSEFGADSFVVERLDVGFSRADLNRLEAKWITKLRTIWPNGYNSTKGGSGNFKGIEVKYKGVVYGSYTQLASRYGINGETLKLRLKQGMDLKSAIETKGHLLYRKCSVAGRKFKSHKAAAEHYGLNNKIVHQRMTGGWTLRQALGIDKRKESKTAPKSVSVGGIEFSTLTDAANHFGLTHGAVGVRKKLGWTVEEAYGLKKRVPKTDYYNAESIIVKSVKYSSLSAAARAFKQPLGRVQMRLRRGWSIDDAFLKPHRDADKRDIK